MECWACGFLTPGSEGLHKVNVNHVIRICPGGWGFTLLRGERVWRLYGRLAGVFAALDTHATIRQLQSPMLSVRSVIQAPISGSALMSSCYTKSLAWVYAGLLEVPKEMDIVHAVCGWDSFVAGTSQGSIHECTLQASPELWDTVAMPSTAALSALAAGEKHRYTVFSP